MCYCVKRKLDSIEFIDNTWSTFAGNHVVSFYFRCKHKIKLRLNMCTLKNPAGGRGFWIEFWNGKEWEHSVGLGNV